MDLKVLIWKLVYNVHMTKVGSLFVVATPIGNMQDLSPRSREVLTSVDAILCEDTRVTQKLLQRFEIETPTRSVHQHSTDKELKLIIESMKTGSSFAFVSDAGTPNVSDPGGKLVAQSAAEGVYIVTIPGPSAVMAAVQVCGFPADTFTFLGFPPHKKGRNTFFERLEQIDHTVVLFESKHRIKKTLEQLPQSRSIFVGRELTKLHETMYRGSVEEVTQLVEKDSQKGEYVLVLAPINWK